MPGIGWSADNVLCKVFLIYFIQLHFSFTNGDGVRATYCNTRIDLDQGHRLYYDGQDTVFIFGSTRDDNRIVTYSISTDTIHQLNTLPISTRFGSIHSDRNGNIFYFGADERNDDKVLKYAHIHQFQFYRGPTSN